MRLRLSVVVSLAGIAASGLTHAQQQSGDAAAALPQVEVSSDRTDLNREELQQTLEQVPGGTNLIDLDQHRGSQSTVAKVLDFEPGIIIQEFFGGNDQPRLNIRGSGIQDNPVSRGIQLLQDGLPMNQADGSFVIGLLDPEQAQYISVYRGSNALRYGGTTLGGAIDFSPRTALNSPRSVSFELGSWGARKGALALGSRWGDWDGYLRASHQQSDGWRTHSGGERTNLALNLGTDRGTWSNRSYLNVTHNQFDIPFLLTKERALSNPRSVIGDFADPNNRSIEDFLNVRTRRPMRDTEQYRIANKTSWYGDRTNASVGVYAEQVNDKFKNPAWQADTKAANYGVDAAIDHTWQAASGRKTRIEGFVSANTGSMPRQYQLVSPVDGSLVRRFGDLDLDATNLVVGGQLIQDIAGNLQAVAAAQYVYNKRDIADRRAPGLLDSTFDYRAFNPKAGLIWSPSKNVRYYANVSRSAEAPTFWQLVDLGPGSVPASPASLYLMTKPLKMQEAMTFEIGTQQRGERFAWEATFFHSRVKNELIAEVQNFAIDGTTVNYDHPTVHQGVELSFNARTAGGVLSRGDFFTMRGVYNYSSFRFKGGRYDGNRVAGVPVHLLMGEVGWQINSKLGVSLNARWQPQDTHIDHFNGGLKQDKFLLLGANVTWKPAKQWQVYLDLHNITNETYQTAYVVRGLSSEDATSGLSTPSFVPGPAFHAFAGVRFSW
ncbi:MAG: TonB-dependent receptor [Burkholderiales bacterium]|nr:TonB-dependent receptor [Burkholderiales bacterium]